MIYLDNAATTFPKPECVYEACDTFARTAAVNAGRGAYKASRAASALIADVRTRILSLADARDQADVVFAPSATVALNQVINGARLAADSTVYVSPYEHNAVLRPLELLRGRIGFELVELPLREEDLSVDVEAARRMFLAKPPTLVCVTAASNVTGYVLPAREVFSAAKSANKKALCLLDASQAFGLVRMPFAWTRADAMVFAGHKTLYGPFGMAGFLLKRGVELEEFIVGGTGVESLSLQMPRRAPGRYESASTNIVAMAGLEASLKWLVGAEARELLKQEVELAKRLVDGLREIPGATVYAAPSPELQTGVASFNLDGFKANEVAAALDDRFDIAVRAGHHCAALIHKHLRDDAFDGTVRASLGAFSTAADVDALLGALPQIDHSMLEAIPDDVLRGSC